MTDDFIENVRRADAAEAARQRAIEGPSRPPGQRRRTKSGSAGGYAQTGLANETRAVRTAVKGTRQTTLNTASFNVGQLVQPGGLTFEEAKQALTEAALDAGLKSSELRAWDLPDRALRDGMKSLRDLDEKAARATTSAPLPTKGKTTSKDTGQQGNDWDDDPRIITVKRLSTVKTRVPMWVWEYDKVGRIQLGTLCMFAGRPAAGKSTAVRWFAARISTGELPGVWEGYPMNCGLYMAEEQLDDTVAPSLIACGADMDRVMSVGVRDNGFEDGLLSVRDEQRLTEELLDNNIRALFVDPVMSTFDSKIMDPHKNTDVRRHLTPYVRIAQAINGVVVTVTHLRKGQVRDVMENINGSSAFGELPRSVFGFAAVGDGMNIMEQVKNSAGPTGLKLEYRLPVDNLVLDDGQVCELPRFQIIGETELSIIDIGVADGEEDATTASADVQWLERYLQIEQPAPSSDVYRTAEKQAGMTRYRVTKARKKLKVRIVSTPKPDAPHTTAWCLPDFKQS